MNEYEKLFSLEGKKALITGGTGGLGSEIARGFMLMGADVAIIGSDEKKAAPVLAEAKSLGRTCLFLTCNIRKEGEIEEMCDTLEKEFGQVDILVNSAGKNILLPAEEYKREAFDDVLELNVTALHMVTIAIGRRFMIPSRTGKIINISSVKSFIGTDKDYIAYCTTKGAVNMYTKQLACEWGKYGINVNAIAPTFVRTPINSFQLDDPAFFKSLTDRIPLGRIGQKPDIASAAIYLASDAAGFVSGQILTVDDGLTAKQ